MADTTADSDSDTTSFKSLPPSRTPSPSPSKGSNAAKDSSPPKGSSAAIDPSPTNDRCPAKEPSPDSDPSPTPNPSTTTNRFPPAEEAAHLTTSTTLKTTANTLFATGSYDSAIQTYDRALAACPAYLDYEVAVLRANIAAAALKQADWKAAVESAGKGVEALEALEPLPLPAGGRKKGAAQQKAEAEAGRGEEAEPDAGEGVEEVDDDVEARMEALRVSGHTLAEVRRLQVKLLLRRAKARSELGGWAELQGADEDYRVLLSGGMEAAVTGGDRRAAEEAVRRLGPRLAEAREREMGEMMGKLRGVGDSILKPFGLSTENFQFVRDEKTGGYSMNFNQNPGK